MRKIVFTAFLLALCLAVTAAGAGAAPHARARGKKAPKRAVACKVTRKKATAKKVATPQTRRRLRAAGLGVVTRRATVVSRKAAKRAGTVCPITNTLVGGTTDTATRTDQPLTDATGAGTDAAKTASAVTKTTAAKVAAAADVTGAGAAGSGAPTPAAPPAAAAAPAAPAAPCCTGTTPADPAPAGGTSTAAPAASALRVGIVANTQGWTGAQNAARVDSAAATGAKWLREEFDWDVIEPAKGTWDFSRYDNVLLNAAHDHLRVLPLLLETPKWAGASQTTIPQDPTDYADYVSHVVARYGPHGSFWAAHPEAAASAPDTFELWNEPYYSNGGDYNPGRYARLVKAASIAGRAADPSARFTLAAENTGHSVGSGWVSWIDDMYAAVPDLNDYFDVVAVHPYGKDVDGLSSGMSFRQFRRIEQIRQAFVDHGASDKPFYITEVGWTTCTQDSSTCVDEATQAADMQDALNRITTQYASFVRAVFVYHANDLGTDESNGENYFGLSRMDGSHKPAYDVFKAFASAH